MRRILLLGLLAALLVASVPGPTFAAAPVASNTYTAPYTGGTKIVRTSVQYPLNTCSPLTSLTAFKQAAANLSTGVVRLDAKAGINGTCTRGTGGGVQVIADAGIRSPSFTATVSGTVHISFHWDLSWRATASSAGFASAGSKGTLFGFLWDLTNNSAVPHSRQFHSFAYLAPATHGFNNSAGLNQTLLISGALSAGHAYRAVTFVEVNVGVWIYSSGGTGSASAAIDMAYRGGYGNLTSMVLS